ncbi:hypothetical protein IAQ61_005260 [Plenodomus lingam]|uniref:uncharacterized protein n=1 Tax=Leptosphaeria maculans TaxID=5022 RepID=UPI00333331EE|nr:hypothetical protein IAQ61_005260 [Plenodomus lingam]
MSPNTSTPRRSPGSPGYHQATNSISQSKQQLTRSMPRVSQRNSTSPSPQTMVSTSRPGSQVATSHPSHAGSRQSSSSGGLVSLPGAGTSALLGDEFNFDIDPALLANLPEFDESFLDEFLAADTLESKVTAPDPMPASDAVYAEDIDSNDQFFLQGSQQGLGIDPVPINSFQQDHQPPFYTAPTGFKWDADLGWDSQHNNFYTDQTQPSTGLSALPGDTYFHPQPSVGYQQHAYPQDTHHGHPTQSYYIPPIPVIEQTGYTPHEYTAPLAPQQAQFDFLFSPRYSSAEELQTRQSKRKRDGLDSSFEEDAPIIKRHRETQSEVPRNDETQPRSSRSDESRHQSVVSDSSSFGRPVKVKPVRAGQKPKKHEDKTWVRINTTTKGETTRTARINAFADVGKKYKYHPLPVGDWQSSSGFKFEYTHHFEMDEFKKQSLSARQIHEYITEYPSDNLRIWIQITPGDSARRYASEPHSRCIFEQCPNRKWGGKATIEVGSYRVAFDEKHKKYGKGVCDPFDCVGFAHLYCMERFLDFAGICEIADVKVDDRSGLRKEPKAIAAFTFLNNKHVYDKLIAEKFIRAAQAGALQRTPEFRDYPNHCDYSRGQPKPHANTLVAALYETNLSHRTRSQIKQFVNRKILPGVFPIHRGDQEMANIDKMVAGLPIYQANVEAGIHKASDLSRYYDQFFPQVNERIKDCLALRVKFQREDEEGTARTRGGSAKRRIPPVEDLEEESGYLQHMDNAEKDVEETGSYPLRRPSAGSHSSPRKKQRLEYNTEPLSQEQHDIFSRIPQLLPQYNGYVQQQQQQKPVPSPVKAPGHFTTQQDRLSPTVSHTEINAGSTASSPNTARNSSCTQFFVENPDVVSFDFSTLDQLSPSGTGTYADHDIDQILDLMRRKSSTLSNGPCPYPSIMKSPSQKQAVKARRSSMATRSTARTASFNAQPVTSSKEFKSNDPPSRVTASVGGPEEQRTGRRSKRIASKVTSP